MERTKGNGKSYDIPPEKKQERENNLRGGRRGGKLLSSRGSKGKAQLKKKNPTGWEGYGVGVEA